MIVAQRLEQSRGLANNHLDLEVRALLAAARRVSSSQSSDGAENKLCEGECVSRRRMIRFYAQSSPSSRREARLRRKRARPREASRVFRSKAKRVFRSKAKRVFRSVCVFHGVARLASPRQPLPVCTVRGVVSMFLLLYILPRVLLLALT